VIVSTEFDTGDACIFPSRWDKSYGYSTEYIKYFNRTYKSNFDIRENWLGKNDWPLIDDSILFTGLRIFNSSEYKYE
jgi:hypothetical protein